MSSLKVSFGLSIQVLEQAMKVLRCCLAVTSAAWRTAPPRGNTFGVSIMGRTWGLRCLLFLTGAANLVVDSAGAVPEGRAIATLVATDEYALGHMTRVLDFKSLHPLSVSHASISF